MVKPTLPNWAAFGVLQEHYRTCSDVFSIESCEFAMDRCLAVPDRKATGTQLANDLLRDGRRYAKTVNDITAFNEEYHKYGNDRQQEYELKKGDSESRIACTLSRFFQLLSAREKEVLTLALKGVTYNDPSLHKYTNIGTRMFRHVLTKVRSVIQSEPRLKQSFYQAINISGYKPADFINLINN